MKKQNPQNKNPQDTDMATFLVYIPENKKLMPVRLDIREAYIEYFIKGLEQMSHTTEQGYPEYYERY